MLRNYYYYYSILGEQNPVHTYCTVLVRQITSLINVSKGPIIGRHWRWLDSDEPDQLHLEKNAANVQGINADERPHVYCCVVDWPSCIKTRDTSRLDKLQRQTGCHRHRDGQPEICGTKEEVEQASVLHGQSTASLHSAISRQKSSFSDRLKSWGNPSSP